MSSFANILKSLRYSTYVIFHPFDGFWDLKHDKRGNVISATIILAMLIIVNILRRQLTGFVINFSILNELNINIQITSIVLPILLWCVSNWAITTLVEGEGTFKDIYITTAYAFVPIILINIPMLILSNILTLPELSIYTLLDVISLLWAGFLILIGIMTIHQFTMSKTIITIIIALVGMIIMMVIGLLFFALIQQMISFAILIYNELAMRQ